MMRKETHYRAMSTNHTLFIQTKQSLAKQIFFVLQKISINRYLEPLLNNSIQIEPNKTNLIEPNERASVTN